MKKSLMVFCLALIFFTACRKVEESEGLKSGLKTETDLSSEAETIPKALERQKGVIQDPEGWILVRLEEGQAFLAFDPDNWPDESGIDKNLSEPVFGRVDGLKGKPVSACAGRMFGLNESLDDEGYPMMPVVVFLMEDGSLEWLLADPSWHQSLSERGPNDLVFSRGLIPWVQDVVKLSLEETGEGVGGMQTIYAKDSAGLRYDLSLPLNFQPLTYATWTLMPEEDDPEGWAYLGFNEAGEATLMTGSEYEALDTHRGTYRLYLAADGAQGKSAGTLELDLLLAEDTPVVRSAARPKVQGSFFAGIDWQNDLWLYPAEGDPLYVKDGRSPEAYRFGMIDAPGLVFDIEGMDDDDLLNHLLTQAPEVEIRFYANDLSALVTGERTDLGDGFVGRDIWLGTNHEDHFVKEDLYTIDQYGNVYWYDPQGDAWINP